jgi:ribosome-binding protein aMBF1 (putative translation factor)
LSDPAWRAVNCDIAHIAGEAPGAPRFDSTMTDEDRRRFDNLLLLCPSCHRRIDRLEPEAHPTELLAEMKRQHECRAEPASAWADEMEVARVVRLALTAFGSGEGRRRADFGEAVRSAREARGLSHNALGKLAGMSGSTVRDVEDGRSNTLASTYEKLARALDL